MNNTAEWVWSLVHPARDCYRRFYATYQSLATTCSLGDRISTHERYTCGDSHPMQIDRPKAMKTYQLSPEIRQVELEWPARERIHYITGKQTEKPMGFNNGR